MRKLLTPEQMRSTEARYMAETKTSSDELMERAARELCNVIVDLYGAERTVYFACGPGGNGGDGYACARMYAQAGGMAFVIELAPVGRWDTRMMRDSAEAAGVTITDDWRALPEPDIWVDAIYGTGLSRPVTGEAADIIERMNSDSSDVIAVDIPSGLDGLTGKRLGTCVCADITVTFQRAKTGHFLNDGLDMCGDILVRDIRIPTHFLPVDAALLVSYDDVKPAPRRRNSYKGDYGHLLIVAGSVGMAGAAAMCAMAAMRTGAGLTTVACPASVVPVIQTLAPCAMCMPLPEKDGAISADAAPVLREAMKGKTCIAAGSGLSRRCAPEIIEEILKSELPAVLDADCLNIISENDALKEMLDKRHIITPHPGEARRLLGRELTHPLADAAALHAMGPQTVLKGASSVICAGEKTYISAAGCPGMAKGGSGDALTGMLGALIAQKLPPEVAAYVGSQLHGLAGEAAEDEFGERGMLPTDLIEMITEVLI